MKGFHHSRLALSFWVVLTAPSVRGAEPCVSNLVHPGKDGSLVYRPYSDRGDTIPDFSNCGYGGGGVRIPDVAAKEVIEPRPGSGPGSGDDRARIQEAIDRVARGPMGPTGFRGAVVLKRGTYRVGDTLKINADGVLLRGAGDGQGTSQGQGGTVLVAHGRKPYALVLIAGRSGPREVPGTRQKIADPYVPVGARRIVVGDGSKFRVGEGLLVIRHGNAAWIHEIGMDRIRSRPGDPVRTRQWVPFDLTFDRVITTIDGNRLTLDAPITCAIEERWGGGEVCRSDDSGRIMNAGVEGLHAVSEFDRAKKARRGQGEYFADEEHATYLVQLEDVKNAWVRDVSTRGFAHGVASIGEGAKWVTIEDASAVDPVSILTGGRRYTYQVSGQLNLVQRCFSSGARHAFIVGARVTGPNVFLDGKAEENYATSEPHHRWSVGGLYDNVDAPIAVQDRQYLGSGHGWAGANYVVWNCGGSLVCQRPPTAQNFAIGFVGEKDKPAFDRPDGWWESFGRHVTPRSLYLAQLADRLGRPAVANIGH